MSLVALVGWAVAVILFLDRMESRKDAKWWRGRAEWWQEQAKLTGYHLDRVLGHSGVPRRPPAAPPDPKEGV